MFILLFLAILLGSLLLGTFIECAFILSGMVDVDER